MNSLEIYPSFVHLSWYEHFPDVPLTEPQWFRRCSPTLFREALAIAAEEDKAGRFKVRDQKNIGSYVTKIISNLKRGVKVKRSNTERRVIEVIVAMKAGYQIKERDKERFREKVVPSGDCHFWTGAKGSRGYGRFCVNGSLIGAHVFAYFMELGSLPVQGELTRLEVAHTCRNASCCNAKHLKLTTKSVNLSERVYRKQVEAGKAGACNDEIIAVHSIMDMVVPAPARTPSDTDFRHTSDGNMMFGLLADKPISQEQHTDTSSSPCLNEIVPEKAELQQAVGPLTSVPCIPPAKRSGRF
jgi:hypothetical protein